MQICSTTSLLRPLPSEADVRHILKLPMRNGLPLGIPDGAGATPPRFLRGLFFFLNDIDVIFSVSFLVEVVFLLTHFLAAVE